uniref:Secreted protein n=1 Tax=Macrostomum lignano TaxID=282301 RepID=A0A1I8F4E6_9PLAT
LPRCSYCCCSTAAAAAVKDSAAATQPQKRRVWVCSAVRPGEKCGCEATVTASAASASAASLPAQLAEYCRRANAQAESRNSAVQKPRRARDQTGRTCRGWLWIIYQLISADTPDAVCRAEDAAGLP